MLTTDKTISVFGGLLVIEIRDRREINKKTGGPLLPLQKALWIEGTLIGYFTTKPLCNVSLIKPKSQLGEGIEEAVTVAIDAALGLKPDKFSIVPERIVPKQKRHSDGDFTDI